jgi:hypothetical protein
MSRHPTALNLSPKSRQNSRAQLSGRRLRVAYGQLLPNRPRSLDRGICQQGKVVRRGPTKGDDVLVARSRPVTNKCAVKKTKELS